jgi:hypothetical protein
MDAHRVDRLAKTVGARLSRRATLGHVAGGGAAALLVTGRRRPAAAQEATPIVEATPPAPAAAFCVAAFTATVQQGPNAGEEFEGTLIFGVEADGAIDQAFLVPEQDDPIPVVGQATGRAINLLFTVADGRFLYGVGTAENPVAACEGVIEGTMGGPFTGPEEGDSGDWIVSRDGILDTCLSDCVINRGQDLEVCIFEVC